MKAEIDGSQLQALTRLEIRISLNIISAISDGLVLIRRQQGNTLVDLLEY